MARAPRGKADYLNLGDWNAVCFECGHKFKASELIKHWQGYYVCRAHFEVRHPQDFVKGVADNQTAPWVQPEPADTFVLTCTLEGSSAMPELAMPGCMIPGRRFIGQFPYSFCPATGNISRAASAAADCWVVGVIA